MSKEEISASTPRDIKLFRANQTLMVARRLVHPFGAQALRAEMLRFGFTDVESTETLLFMLERNMLVIANPETTGEARYGLPDESVSPYYLCATASGVRLTASAINEDDFGRPVIELRIEGKSGRAGKVHTFSYEALLSLIAQAHDVRNRIERYVNKETTVS